MRCYICDFFPEENPHSNNHVFVDKKTGLEVCQVCYEVALEAGMEFELPEENIERSSQSPAAVSRVSVK